MAQPGPVRDLTRRQLQIADGIARGLTYAEIGAELAMSRHTVSAHVRMIAQLFDPDDELGRELAPRQVIWTWMQYLRWERERPPRPAR